MFSLISGAYEQWKQSRVHNVLLLGLDGAGKTTLLERVKQKNNPDIQTVPTVGMNMAILPFRGKTLRLWDLGGNESLHSIWQNYYAESDGVIFVIDGNDWKRIEMVRDCFSKVTSTDDLEGVPFLILVNKQDLQANIDLVAKIKEAFNPILQNMGARECRVASCSALSGVGVEEAISWISNQMTFN